MTASPSLRQFNNHLVGLVSNGLGPVERVRAFLAIDKLELLPVHDGLDFARPESERGKHIVAYDLHDVGANRGKVGRLSLTFISALARMHPSKMALALCIGNSRETYAKNRKGRG